MPVSASAISPLTCSTAPRTPLPPIALAAVAQLDRLELPGRRARRDDGAASGAALEEDLDLDRRVARGSRGPPAPRCARYRTCAMRSMVRGCCCCGQCCRTLLMFVRRAEVDGTFGPQSGSRSWAQLGRRPGAGAGARPRGRRRGESGGERRGRAAPRPMREPRPVDVSGRGHRRCTDRLGLAHHLVRVQQRRQRRRDAVEHAGRGPSRPSCAAPSCSSRPRRCRHGSRRTRAGGARRACRAPFGRRRRG